MKRKLAAPMVAVALGLCLFGCSSFSAYTENAQQKADNLAGFASADLSAATGLAAPDALNYPAAAQCLPVLTKWLTQLKTNADRYRDVKGAVSAVIYHHWAEQTLSHGIPENVTLACSAMWVTEKGAFTNTFGTVKTLLGK